jgi:hypothetical protein
MAPGIQAAIALRRIRSQSEQLPMYLEIYFSCLDTSTNKMIQMNALG